MSSIKPINFVKVAQQENVEAGSRGKQVGRLINDMHLTNRSNLNQVLSPSPIKHVIDAGAKGTQVKIVVEEMDSSAKAAMSSDPPKIIMATPLKKLNII